MRAREVQQGLTVQAIAGTHAVLLGFDFEDATGCLGFGIHRSDHTEGEAYWLRGLKAFASVVPQPTSGMDFSFRQQPLQGFQWGDYTAKPGHDYTYRIVALGGTPAALTEIAEASVDVSSEAEDDGIHGVWFNRGVAGSQAFVKRFGQYTPPVGADETHPAFGWLSRGLGEAFVRFVGQATDNQWGLRGAFYEFTWQTGLVALAAAAQGGADVQLVVHGRDRDIPGGGADMTADDNRAAVTAAGLTDNVVWRTAANRSALQHNKFLVLTNNAQPVAVWTGSTNLTQGAVFGHLNVGHLIHDPTIAAEFLDYWTRLADPAATTGTLRAWTELNNPVDLTSASAPPGLTTVLSPRATTSKLLDWYATLFDGAASSAHITGAFGIHRVFRDKLAVDRDRVRTVLLDKKPRPAEAIPTTDEDVRRVWGDYLHQSPSISGPKNT